MAVPTTFEESYGVTPWPITLDKNTRTVYVPELMARFVKQSVFYRMINYSIDLGAMRSKKVVFTQRLTAPPNIVPLDNRALWLPEIYTDSREIEITCSRFGDKIQLHKYDDRITQWREGNALGLRAIMRQDLAPHMVDSLDLLARNAFLSSPFVIFAGGATGFDDLAADDLFEVERGRAFKLRMAYKPDLFTNPLFCITAPTAAYTVRNSVAGTQWYDRNAYANPGILVNGEIGMFEDTRFVQTPMLTLWNCGAILGQTTVDVAISTGDGAPDPTTTKVDGVWAVGQEGATHSISLVDASAVGAVAGDVLTFHRVKNLAQDKTHVLNGVKWEDPYNLDVRVVGVNGNFITLDTPVMVDWFKTAISGAPGVYAYVTKARPVHAAIYIFGPDSVVAGVIQPPQTYEPRPIDDTEAVWRFSWDAYLKYQPFQTTRSTVYFYAGPIDRDGLIVNL